MSPLRFAGKHCAIVGATGIIGVQIAKAFARHGAVVSLLGRTALQSRSKLERELAPVAYAPPTPLQPDTPSEHQFIRLDVADPADIKSVFGGRGAGSDQSPNATAVGPLDILVNCAGISQTTLLKRTPDPELAGIIDTNLLATMLVCKYAKVRPNGMTPLRLAHCYQCSIATLSNLQQGCIINVSSLMATKGGLGATAYAASKAGVIGFTRALCREMAPRSIRVNALLPGWVESPMWDREYTTLEILVPFHM
ncbi:3-ketoacyl-(Acyl-carrier-protein) reductase [Tolypocladium paradoxum]|uniref:3-ketoacyl-(Acyl-carrier-protein) reductase n=1 Tax=Tolypocladium paradoxum TaxID=94208 RepID=A0A2S4L7C6_9HYPO|nr:3-ketoacyl-(Acyl-carrier-protein) reductase [Tolypocladium paradoxum]